MGAGQRAAGPLPAAAPSPPSAAPAQQCGSAAAAARRRGLAGEGEPGTPTQARAGEGGPLRETLSARRPRRPDARGVMLLPSLPPPSVVDRPPEPADPSNTIVQIPGGEDAAQAPSRLEGAERGLTAAQTGEPLPSTSPGRGGCPVPPS